MSKLTKIEKDVVTKSNKLIEASFKLGLTEQKFILFMVSKIQPDDKDFKIYTLSVREFADIIGLKGQSIYSEVKKISYDLMGKPVQLELNGRTIQMSWLSLAIYNDFSGTVDVRFDPFWKPFFLELKKEFTSYKLANIASLKSFYSIRLYELLKQYERIGERTFEIDVLKQRLGAEEAYPLYGNFKQRVLIPAQKEIKTKTDISFDFEEIKQGRKVDKIYFKIEGKEAPIKLKSKQMSLFEEEGPSSNKDAAPEEEEEGDLIRKTLESQGITISDRTLKKWRTLDGDLNILSAIKETFGRDHVTNVIGYVTRMLEAGYTPAQSVKVKPLPTYMTNTSNGEQLQKELDPEKQKEALDLLFQLGEIDQEAYDQRLRALNVEKEAVIS